MNTRMLFLLPEIRSLPVILHPISRSPVYPETRTTGSMQESPVLQMVLMNRVHGVRPVR